jgi:hypothetical protein
MDIIGELILHLIDFREDDAVKRENDAPRVKIGMLHEMEERVRVIESKKLGREGIE